MKLLKPFLILLVSVIITSCSSSNNNDAPYVLTTENIAGTYEVTNFNIDTKVTSATEVAGVLVPFPVATSTSNGDTFQIDFILNTDGTFTAIGQYRVITVVTPAVGSAITDTTILLIDEAGTYQVDADTYTLQISASNDGFLQGNFTIVTFNEDTVILKQETEEVIDTVTTEIETNISFVRN